jgi:hypothetical protein
VAPRGVRFSDGFAFGNVEASTMSIESGSTRLAIPEDLLIAIVNHRLIRNLSPRSSVIIPCDIEIHGSECFAADYSLKSVLFESNSRLTRIESKALSPDSDPITVPFAVLFVAQDASPGPSQLSLCDEG